MADLFAVDAPPSQPAAPLAADRRPAGATPHQKPGERPVRLPDGSRVSSWSEDWREACEVAWLCDCGNPDAEMRLCADKRSAKDPQAAERILARLRQLVAGELRRREVDAPALALEARAILSLPDKAARRALLAEVDAADGCLRRIDLERAILALWRQSETVA